ncbi:methyltransferase domain-containing protein [Nitrospira sp. Nam74]
MRVDPEIKVGRQRGAEEEVPACSATCSLTECFEGRPQCSVAVGVDRHRSPAVNVIANLKYTLPFADDTVDHIFAVHVFEHVREGSRCASLHRAIEDRQ